jgi:hypothetical protein
VGVRGAKTCCQNGRGDLVVILKVFPHLPLNIVACAGVPQAQPTNCHRTIPDEDAQAGALQSWYH